LALLQGGKKRPVERESKEKKARSDSGVWRDSRNSAEKGWRCYSYKGQLRDHSAKWRLENYATDTVAPTTGVN